MKKNRLPGDPKNNNIFAKIIRVNQAGEYGAKRIYEGQLSVLKNSDKELVQHMYEQELLHLQYFNTQIIKQKIRPSLLQPLWHVAGWTLGAVSAKISKKMAMACTVAVEEVIDKHYQKQIYLLNIKLKTVNNKFENNIETRLKNEIENKIKNKTKNEIEDRYQKLKNQKELIYDLLIHIKKFREEELEHKNIGLQNDAELAPAYLITAKFIKMLSKISIWFAERV